MGMYLCMFTYLLKYALYNMLCVIIAMVHIHVNMFTISDSIILDDRVEGTGNSLMWECNSVNFLLGFELLAVGFFL